MPVGRSATSTCSSGISACRSASGSSGAGRPGVGGGEGSGLGDDAAAGAVVQGDERSGVRYVVVAWRYGNVVGTLVANGFAPSFTATQGLSLARTQQQKSAAAGQHRRA